MASSASGQDERNRSLWLATRTGKMQQSCPLGTTRCIPQAKFPQKPYNKSFIDQVCSVKMAGYWRRSIVSVHKHAKKNLANIQPPWPHTWSVTHTYEAAALKTWLQQFSILISKNTRNCYDKQDQAGSHMWVTVKLWTLVIETTVQVHSRISCARLIIIYTVVNKYCTFEDETQVYLFF